MKGCVPIWVLHDVAPLCTGEPSGYELPVESSHHMASLICVVNLRRVCPKMPTIGPETGSRLVISRPHLA